MRVASDWDRVCRARRWSVSAETGNDVACVDVNAAKIEALGQNKIPIYEPGLEELVERNQSQQRLQFTTDVARPIGGAEVAFIAVGTPPDEDGAADFTHVLAVAETTLIDGLLAAGVTVVAHDPAAMPQSRRRLGIGFGMRIPITTRSTARTPLSSSPTGTSTDIQTSTG